MSGEIIIAVVGGVALVGGALITFLGTKGKTQTDAIAARFDDASELAKYIDARVEEKVAPIRDELATVKRESHEIQDAFRTWVSAVWLWHQRGRLGDLPMPPAVILSRLGLGHFVEEWPTEQS